MFQKAKERDVAPTRGQFPCPAFGPHGASLSAWVCLDFFLDLFSSFFFFLCPFSLGFSIQTRYLSSIVSLDTFAHAHRPKTASSKCQKKFGTIYHFDINLIWSRWVNRWDLPSWHIFTRSLSEKERHTAKNDHLSLIQSCILVYFSKCKILKWDEIIQLFLMPFLPVSWFFLSFPRLIILN